MSNPNISDFIKKVQGNDTLIAQFKNVRSDEQLSAMAASVGYNFDSSEIKQCKETMKSLLFKGSDLDSISGGASVVAQWYSGD